LHLFFCVYIEGDHPENFPEVALRGGMAEFFQDQACWDSNAKYFLQIF